MDLKSKRIAKNTFYLYIRMAILMLVNVFTSRILLDKLGVDDYGIYNVVGGITALFGFFSSSLTNASLRFLAVELGKNNIPQANAVFNQHLQLYALVILFIVVVSETIGIWFVGNKLNIDPSRIYAATCVFHFTVASFCITLLGIVFNACIVAHEAMNVYAIVSIFDGFAKLGIAYLISISSMDRLIFYGALMFVVTFLAQTLYASYCFIKFPECRLRWIWDRQIMKKTGALVSWNMLGTAVYAVNDSGVNILMNLFFGPAINAARALSYQVSAAIGNFSNNFYTSVRPQLMKSYAAKDNEYMLKLFYSSGKYSFFLLWVVCIPILFCSKELLAIWLVEVPEYAGVFTIWILIYGLVNTLNNPIWTIALASGELKKYILIGSGVFLLIFPLSYIALKLGASPISVFVIMVGVRLVYLYVVLRIISSYIYITRHDYLKKVIYPIVKSVVVSLVVIGGVYCIMPVTDLLHTIVFCILAVVIAGSCVWLMGTTRGERIVIIDMVKRRIHKI